MKITYVDNADNETHESMIGFLKVTEIVTPVRNGTAVTSFILEFTPRPTRELRRVDAASFEIKG